MPAQGEGLLSCGHDVPKVSTPLSCPIHAQNQYPTRSGPSQDVLPPSPHGTLEDLQPPHDAAAPSATCGTHINRTTETLLEVIREHFQHCTTCEEALVLTSASKSVLISLCEDYLSPRRFRYTLFLHTRPTTLLIRPMPKGPHSYAENYFADLLTEMCRAHVLTEAEAQSLMRSSDDVYLPTGRFRLAGGLDPADIKVADLAFVPRAGRATPLLVIEVGFSQSYDNPNHKKLGLLQNAQHWLEQTKGRVKCVVLISINEDKTLQEADAGDDRENHDTLQNDSEQGMDNDWHTDSASTSSSQSTISEYEAQLARFASSPTLVSHFTYPLTAFVELWRYDPPMKRMVQSGARVTLLPTLSAPDITITRMDLGFSPRTANNEFRLPMAPLAIGLAGSARVRLAYQRYLDRGKASRSMGDMDKTVYPDQEDGNEGCDNL